LNSSIRELRIAAGRALGVFLADVAAPGFDKDVTKRNRTNALGILKSLSDKNNTEMHETCILAWGQVGRVASDSELNLVLIKLIEYLGHRNMMVSAFAFNELLNLAHSRSVSPRRLFQPFWSSIAYSVVKDMLSRPQTTRMVAELLQLSISGLLRLVQRHALPWLILTKKRDIVQKIAEARGESDTWQACLDTANFPPIIALLMIQDAPDIAEMSMSLLKQASAHFEGLTLVELLRTEPLLISLELLKSGVDANETRKTRVSVVEAERIVPLRTDNCQVRAALTTLASLLSPDKDKKDNKDKKAKKTHVIGRYLQQHALGLVSRLSEVITDTLGQQPPVQEQRRCLGAMEEMIRICKSYVCVARPQASPRIITTLCKGSGKLEWLTYVQISACLLSALAVDELRTCAFSCWAVMLTHMEETDVESQLETTFFLISHYWKVFNEEARSKVKSLLVTLLEKHQPILASYADRLPSLSHIDELADLSRQLDTLRVPLGRREAFVLFAERMKHENPGVVEQTLIELIGFLRKHQDYLQVSAINEQHDSVVTTLMRSLLDCSSKYSGWQSIIPRLCTEAIGLVGCLDSNRIETVREHRRLVIIHNFEDASETTDFVAFLLENSLVKTFQSTTDTKLLGFLSYAMQELLAATDFKAAIETKGEGHRNMPYKRWGALSENTRDTLTPFLTSRFNVAPMAPQTTEYPIFRPGRSYESWLRTFVLDLLRNGQNEFSRVIFQPLCRLVKAQDLSVAEFLLPFVVMHVVIGQSDSVEFRDKVAAELNGILQYQPPETASYVQREETKVYFAAVFRIIDYFMTWLQVKKSQQNLSPRGKAWINRVEETLTFLDPEVISQRAIDCNEYARALFFLEPHMQAVTEIKDADGLRLIQTLQHIYTQIDDPDGLEGLSAHLQNVDLNHQALNHRKAGRWTAAQTWYEIQLAEQPDSVDVQLDLLACLKESGQHDVLLNYVEGMKRSPASVNKIMPFAAEASWVTGRWDTLEKYLRLYNAGDVSEVFNLGIAQALLYLKEHDMQKFKEQVQMMRDKVAGSLTHSATSSLRTCHDALLKCHVLTDLEMIANEHVGSGGQQATMAALDRRLEVLGAYVSDKQYILGVSRAAMELKR